MKAVVITFDRLPASMLGCYGNDWGDTPNFDAFAAGSLVLENCFIEKLWDGSIQPAWWSGRSCFNRDRQNWADFSLLRLLQDNGVHTSCVIDESVLPPDDLMPPFADCQVVLNGDCSKLVQADEIGRAANQLLSSGEQESCLVWVALPGMHGLPDSDFLDVFEEDFADIDVTRDFVDDVIAAIQELPDPIDGLREIDPRVAELILSAEASQCDVIFGRLLAALSSADVILVTAGFGGAFQVVEPHQSAGTVEAEVAPTNSGNRLCDQQFHVPGMIRTGTNAHRETAIALPADLLPTLLDVFQVAPPEAGQDGQSWLAIEPDKIREFAFVSDGAGQIAVRSHDYLLVQADGQPDRLYVKPDDVWDVQDQSAQAQEDVAALQQVLEKRGLSI